MDTKRQKAAEALYAAAHFFIELDRHVDASDVFRVMTLCAPNDERGWLGLGLCHEALDQPDVALQMYATGQVAAAPAARCAYAMALLHTKLGADEKAEEMLDIAERCAARRGDDEIAQLVEQRRRAA